MPSAAEPLQTSANIPLDQIRESPHNHRKHFDEARLQELATSVKAHGVLQPVLVRPTKKAPAGANATMAKVKYELVYGHRRYRAARLAGLKTLPATVRELDDKAALEVALIENCRREDVLPMEEAEGYFELHHMHGVSVEQIAEQVGKSKEYVYGRLKLCELKAPTVRKALDAGKLEPSTALLVARIPGEKLQEAAAKKILEGGAWDEEASKPGPMSYRRAQRLVSDEYMLQLGKAPFNTKDTKLVPEAGACGPCPKRTGNCMALYPDVKSENVCTDPECFGRKKAAAFKLEAAAAAERGQKLLKDNKNLWDWEGKKLGYKGQERYVELKDVVPGDKKKRTFKDLLGDKAKVVLARDPNGKVHQLLEKEGLGEALAAAGHKVKLQERGGHGGRDEDYAKQREEEQFRARVVMRLLSVSFAKVSSSEVSLDDALRFIIRFMHEAYEYELAEVWQRHAEADKMEAFIAGADLPTLGGLLMEATFGRRLRQTWNEYAPGTTELCAALGLELKALEKEQKEADAAAPAAPSGAGGEGPEQDGEDA